MQNFSAEIQNTLPQFIASFMQKNAERACVTCIGKTHTFAEINALSDKFAHFLQYDLGLIKGDRLAIQLPNMTQYFIVTYGALKAGVVVVNCNPMYTPREMKHQFSDSGAVALVIFKPMLPKYESIAAQVGIKHVIQTDISDMLDCTHLVKQEENGNYNLLPVLLEADSDYVTPEVTCHDICVLQYTGGTTGVSKGAMLTHQNIIANTYQTINGAPDAFRQHQELMIQPLPLYHIFAFAGTIFMQASQGNHSILIPNPSDLDGFVTQIENQPFTMMCGLNTLFVGLSRHPGFKALDFSYFNATISGGTALTKAASDAWESVTGVMPTEGFGLSETSPVISINDPKNIEIGTVGKPVFDTVVKMLDPQGNEVANGETGELAVYGPQVMQGYWQRQDETNEVMTPDGFFKTGDIAYRNKNDNICIVDRLKDMIIVSGFNVFPNEVEGVLTANSEVIEAAVVGKPDDKTGERVVAYVTTTGRITEAEILVQCKIDLTAYKIPKEIHILEQLPKSSVGKILRKELR